MALMRSFGLTIHVGDDIAHSPHQQVALLTLVNAARRTFLAGVEVVGLPDAKSLTGLSRSRSLSRAVEAYGGRVGVAAETGLAIGAYRRLHSAGIATAGMAVDFTRKSAMMAAWFVMMLYRLHISRTCRVAVPFRASIGSGIAAAFKGRCDAGHEHRITQSNLGGRVK
jgi:hypothetical protein